MEIAVDGKKIFAATGGKPFDPQKPAIVFLHGAGMDHSVWALQTRYFAHHGHSVLAVDLPGHGKSQGPLLESIADLADWTARLIAAAGLEKAALCGHSQGALVALETAARHPGKVAALGLLGIATEMPVHPDMLASAKENGQEVIELMTSWAHARAHHLGGHRAPGLWMLGAARRLLERAPKDAIHVDLKSCDEYKDAKSAAEKIRCKTLLVLGAEDMMTPAKKGKELASLIPGARVHVISDSGHMMMHEAPDETLDALRALA